MQSFSQNLKKTSIINRFLFPAPHSSYTWSSFEGELLAIVGRTGNIVPCTVMPGMCARQTKPEEAFTFDNPSTHIVIYCHANGEDVGLLNEAGHWLCDTLGVHVMLPEYPGYGVAPGVPNEVSINENIRACYDFAVHGLNWDPLKVLLFGRSIGTGPAIQLASELPVGGLILVSPYSSIKELVSQHVGLLSAFLMVEMADIFPSDQRIKQVKCPTLIVHGATDLVIDCAQAKKLYLNSGGEPKRLVVLDGVGHHGIDLHFAVVHEFARIFQDDFEPRYLNIDGFLADPAVQGDTVASPVPVFDCRSMNWSRPTLVRGSTPFLRTPPAGSLAAHASYVAPPPQASEAEEGASVSGGAGPQSGGSGGGSKGRAVEGEIVTDQVLLAHMKSIVADESSGALQEASAFSRVRISEGSPAKWGHGAGAGAAQHGAALPGAVPPGGGRAADEGGYRVGAGAGREGAALPGAVQAGGGRAAVLAGGGRTAVLAGDAALDAVKAGRDRSAHGSEAYDNRITASPIKKLWLPEGEGFLDIDSSEDLHPEEEKQGWTLRLETDGEGRVVETNAEADREADVGGGSKPQLFMY